MPAITGHVLGFQFVSEIVSSLPSKATCLGNDRRDATVRRTSPTDSLLQRSSCSWDNKVSNIEQDYIFLLVVAFEEDFNLTCFSRKANTVWGSGVAGAGLKVEGV